MVTPQGRQVAGTSLNYIQGVRGMSNRPTPVVSPADLIISNDKHPPDTRQDNAVEFAHKMEFSFLEGAAILALVAANERVGTARIDSLNTAIGFINEAIKRTST